MSEGEFKNPLCSIIMPTFRQPKYLQTSVYGVMSQTYPNVELIIVSVEDDAETEERICDILDLFPQVVTVVSPEANIIRQINLGLKEAKGEFTSLTASDDFYLPGKIAGEMRLANEKNAVLVYSSFFYADEDLCLTGVPKVPPFSYETLVRRNYITDNALVKRSMFDEFGLFDESLEILAVYDKWLHIAEKYPERIVLNPVPTFLYRQHSDQAHKKRLDKPDKYELYRKVISESLKRKGIKIKAEDMRFEITDA